MHPHAHRLPGLRLQQRRLVLGTEWLVHGAYAGMLLIRETAGYRDTATVAAISFGATKIV